MKVYMIPVDELVAHAACCNCKQSFVDDEFYCQVWSLDESPIGSAVYVLICIGCAAQLTCGFV